MNEVQEWIVPLIPDNELETALVREAQRRFNNSVIRTSMICWELEQIREALLSREFEQAMPHFKRLREHDLPQLQKELEYAQKLLQRHIE